MHGSVAGSVVVQALLQALCAGSVAVHTIFCHVSVFCIKAAVRKSTLRTSICTREDADKRAEKLKFHA